MIEIPRILCPVDFSECSRRALQYAAATARWYESRLTVLHVVRSVPPVDMIPPLSVDSTQRLALSDVQPELTAVAKRFADDAVGRGLQVDLVVEEASDVHYEIVDRAATLHADLVVMGTHGRSGFARFMLGSVTEKVLRASHAPVMVVPPHAETTVPAGDARFDSVLCAVDFSDCSVTALTCAMSFAQEADARLTVLNVVEVAPEPDGQRPAVAVSVAQARAAERAGRLQRLRALIPDSVRTYCHVETTVEEGKPYREILKLADEWKVDLIVMGAQSHGAIDRLLFGSNAQQMVRTAGCPVLAIPRRA